MDLFGIFDDAHLNVLRAILTGKYKNGNKQFKVDIEANQLSKGVCIELTDSPRDNVNKLLTEHKNDSTSIEKIVKKYSEWKPYSELDKNSSKEKKN